jgi:two-component system nitrogen regulation response regulator NtrX
MSQRVLVVDDERNLRAMLEQMLALAGYAVECVESGEAAVARAAEGGLDAVLLDVRLGAMDGLATLRELRQLSPDVAVVMMSGHGTIETAVQAVRAGAFDFLEKPLTRDKTLLTLENAVRLRRLAVENQRLRAGAAAQELLGDSAPMVALRARIDQVGPTEARVLITGESGTGKELVARAIHARSRRADGPLLAVNCAAVPGELIESELFGHVRGAFTGATAPRTGVFEAATGGTLFLDEIGDMPLSMQAKLLRVLETSEITRVGTSRCTRVDVRAIAATHRDLAAAVRAGSFRDDLLHRLNVFPLHVPPLRERAQDVALLAERFLREEVVRQKLGRRHFSSQALQRLGRYGWPGNVRELRNIVERLAILSTQETIDAALVDSELPPIGADGAAAASNLLRDAVEAAERRAILAAVRGAGGNITEAARRLGLERSHLYKKAKALRIDLGAG